MRLRADPRFLLALCKEDSKTLTITGRCGSVEALFDTADGTPAPSVVNGMRALGGNEPDTRRESRESGGRESNPRHQLGRLRLYR